MSNGVILLKRPYISPKIAPRGSECKTTCRKSWPGNLIQVLNLTFDPCFKVKSGHHTKTSLFLPFYWDHKKSWPANVLSEKFWSYFEKQNGHHSELFQNHQDALKLEISQLG